MLVELEDFEEGCGIRNPVPISAPSEAVALPSIRVILSLAGFLSSTLSSDEVLCDLIRLEEPCASPQNRLSLS